MLRKQISILILVILTLGPSLAVIAQQGGNAGKRAKPPRFDDSEFEGVFFKNVFDITVGERPNKLGSRPTVGPTIPGGNQPSEGGNNATGLVGNWAQYVSAAALEDELKSIKLQTDKTVTTPTKFRSGGYRENRINFSVAAMLFAVISEFDGEVRWKENSAGARDVFARSAANCKVGSAQAFNEAKIRKADLQDLIGGGAFQGKAEQESNSWDKICDRSPLMKRIELAFEQTLKPMTANKSAFGANLDKVRHEAEIVALIGEVCTKEGMEDFDDEDYAAFAKAMRDAARQVVAACKDKDATAASAAVGTISKSCSECHEAYRG